MENMRRTERKLWISDYEIPTDDVTAIQAIINGSQYGFCYDHELTSALASAIQTGVLDFYHVRSIPDIWGEQLIYESMFNSGNADGAELDDILRRYRDDYLVVNWRALLATIALLADRDEIRVVPLPTARENMNAFAKALVEDGAIPTSTIWGGNEPCMRWVNSLIICHHVGDTFKPIAMTSPTTLIVPTADSFEYLASLKCVPWIYHATDAMDNVCLRVKDPSKYDEDMVVESGINGIYGTLLHSIVSRIKTIQRFATEMRPLVPRRDASALRMYRTMYETVDTHGELKQFLDALERNVNFGEGRIVSYPSNNMYASVYEVPKENDDANLVYIDHARNTYYYYIDLESVRNAPINIDGIVIGQERRDRIKAEPLNTSLTSFDTPSGKHIKLLTSATIFSEKLYYQQFSINGDGNADPQASVVNMIRGIRDDDVRVSAMHHDACLFCYNDPDGSKTYSFTALPFKRDFFEDYSIIPKIACHVSTSFDGRSYTVSIAFNHLKVSEDGTESYDDVIVGTASKVFSRELATVVRIPDNMLTSAIWPSKNLGERWTHGYYLLSATNGSNNDYNFEFIKNNVVSNSYEDRIDDVVQNSTKYTISKVDSFPRFIKLVYQDIAVGYVEFNESKGNVGTRMARYAIDFGTSATVICKNVDDESGLLNWKNISPTVILANSRSSDVLAKYFIPYSSGEVGPFQTLMLERDQTQTRGYRCRADGLLNACILSASIFFKANITNLPFSNTNQNAWVWSDLKWDCNPDAVARTQLFFGNMYLLILCDALFTGISSFHLKVSYPLSMKYEQQRGFSESVESTARHFFGPNIGTDTSLCASIRLIDESLATSYFARARVPNDVVNQCVIDIGGGTTDVCIRLADVERCFSLRIGGRDAFISAIKENAYYNRFDTLENSYRNSYLYSILSRCSLISTEELSRIPEDLIKTTCRELECQRLDYSTGNAIRPEVAEAMFASRFEGILSRRIEYQAGGEVHERNAGEIIVDKITSNGIDISKTDKYLSAIILTNVTAIAFYVGQQVRALANEKQIMLDKRSLSLFFCGNGSRMLDWIGTESVWKEYVSVAFAYGAKLYESDTVLPYDGMTATDIEMFDTILKDVNSRIRNRQRPPISISSSGAERKHEVALGMFYLPDNRITDVQNVLINGERFEYHINENGVTSTEIAEVKEDATKLCYFKFINPLPKCYKERDNSQGMYSDFMLLININRTIQSQIQALGVQNTIRLVFNGTVPGAICINTDLYGDKLDSAFGAYCRAANAVIKEHRIEDADTDEFTNMFTIKPAYLICLESFVSQIVNVFRELELPE